MSAVDITIDNFVSEVLESDKPVLLDFWAEWCPPCRMLSPVVEEIANEKEDIKVCKINADKETALADAFKIMAMPTLIFIKDGAVSSFIVGAKPKSVILEMIGA